ncbi:MAG: DNA recombination protein RmuC [Bacteroidales bacterium]|nr:DNA recombination protein RmuC [Bacteroidales bacterium]
MEILFFVLGLLIGMIAVWIFLSKKIEKINLENNQVREEKIKLQAEVDNFIKNQDLIEKQITQSIESYVLKAMKHSNDNFINLARQTLEKYFVEADKGLQNKTLEIEKIIQPLQKNLENYDKKIVDFQTETSKNIGNIKTYLSELATMQHELTKQTNSLVGALKSPRIRGRWGEIGLRRIVEYSGLNEYCDFSEQVHDKLSGQRPDLIINLPENRQIIVDSKLPLEAYLDAVEAENPETQTLFLKKHLVAVKDNLKRLSAKNYSDNFDSSIDFVVMYIEIEPALSAALILDHGLINDALRHNIIIATPTTFIALLQTVAYGWRQYQMSENALQILAETKEFYARTSVFTEHFEQIGKMVNNLVEKYNQATGSWNRRVEPSLRRIEELGVKDTKKEIKDINEVEKRAKDFKED